MMKLLLEILISLFLHPIAVVLAWINIAGRKDLTVPLNIVWAIVSLIWGLGPILYLLAGKGNLW